MKSQVEAQASQDSVAIFFKGKQVARHARSLRQGGFTTNAHHMPEPHRKHQAWTPERLISWGARIGPATQSIVLNLLEQKKVPEQAYRVCLGLLNLAKQYTPERLEAACLRAQHINARRLANIKSILESNMDQLPLPLSPQTSPSPQTETHRNVRGADYYH
ncbi:hypothetical protein A3757_23540 [Oleiphilus sp. HI0117]|nr:hypothetical protein A3757_23540 [Oleiphilus sp. HI0117]